MVIGPIISLDEWVPERPPKNPALRIPSPELPPPPPPPPMICAGDTSHLAASNAVADDGYDEPLPPPPPEVMSRHVRQLSEPEIKQATPSRRNSFAGQSTGQKTPMTTSSSSLYRGGPLERLSPPQRSPASSPPQPPPPVVPKKTLLPPSSYHQHQTSQVLRPYPMSVYTHQQQHPHNQHNQHNNHQHHQHQQQQQPQRAIAISKQPLNGITTMLVPHKQPSHGNHGSAAAKLDLDLAARQLEGSRLTMRKRSHNAQLTPVEMPAVNAKLMLPPSPPHPQQHQHQQQQQQPPPLKPRLPLMAAATAEAIGRSASAMGNRLR